MVKAKSEQSLASTVRDQNSLNKNRSRSLEPLSGLAMWASEPVLVELKKGDQGLGFCILDYQVGMVTMVLFNIIYYIFSRVVRFADRVHQTFLVTTNLPFLEIFKKSHFSLSSYVPC